jgi:acyl-CoA dehydrogenase
VDFEPSDKTKEIQRQLERFMDQYVYPAERVAAEQIEASGDDHHMPEIIVELQGRAKEVGLWNLFLPDEEHGAGLTNLEYAPLAEIMGRSGIASRIFNCAAPDTGNMEILAEFGNAAQQKKYLQPLLDGKIRSCFSMTEPEVSSADPTQLTTLAKRDGDDYVLNGNKWFTTGAIGSEFAIVMAVTDPTAAPHERASMILVPTATPGFHILRAVSVMGHTGGGGHCEIRYEDCRVPVSNRLGAEGAGFAIAQARLGPGRVHHCMRAIGGAQRAYEIMVDFAAQRKVGGEPLGSKQFIQDFIATSKMEIDQARLFTLYTAWKMDTVGKKAAAQEISMIKVIAANLLMDVCDRSIQTMGALGVSDDTPVAAMWRNGRALRIADGPDEVHKMVIARGKLKRWAGLSLR